MRLVEVLGAPIMIALRMRLGLLTKKEKEEARRIVAILDPETKNFCSGCKYSINRSTPKYASCTHPKVSPPETHSKEQLLEHLVSGEPLPPLPRSSMYCIVARDSEHLCGNAGVYWAPQ